MSEVKTNVRVLPMPVPHPVWYGQEGGYPDELKVSFRDGKVRTYKLEVEQPKPQVISTKSLIQMFKENTYGGYKPKHAKK